MRILWFLALSFAGATQAIASPEPSALLYNAHGQNQALASIGRLHSGSVCTATLFKPDPKAQGRALIMTNGHCVMGYGAESAFLVKTNTPAPAGWNVTFNYFIDTKSSQATYPVTSIVYASMKTIDLAILELNVTWEALEAAGYTAPVFTEKAPEPDEPIRVVGAPLMDDSFLREARCHEEGRVSIGEWYWTWFQTHRNSCADIYPGSSGSPVFNQRGEVFALINTSSAGGTSDTCFIGQPCELQATGARLVPNRNYAINTNRVIACFPQQNLSFGPQCGLPPTDSVEVQNAPNVPTAPLDSDGQAVQGKIRIHGEIWKFGLAGEVDCFDPKGYQSVPLALPEKALSNGVYLLCTNNSGQDFRFPTITLVSIDSQPPTEQPLVSTIPSDDGFAYEPIFHPPELSDFSIGYGPLQATDCSTLPLHPYRRFPEFVDAKHLPVKICVRIGDNVGNVGPTFSYAVYEIDQNPKPIP